MKNSEILKTINLPLMESIIVKRHLHWIGKMVGMDEDCLPLKMLSCWTTEPQLSQQPNTTIRNSLVRSLQIVNPDISDNGKLKEWFHQAKEILEWNNLTLDPLDPDHNPTSLPTVIIFLCLQILFTTSKSGVCNTPCLLNLSAKNSSTQS
jgi:hypothetical protein